jgi:Transposase, Mutator family
MRAPVLAIGDGALGFWGALREVFPDTREQRCWFHKISNVLAALPKSAHPGAKKALAEIWNAEDKRHALDAINKFEAAYGAKFPKAVAKIIDDVEQLLAFYDFPAEHWIHLRTTNRVNLRHRAQSEQDHKGPRLTRGGNRHGLQADRVRTVTLARGERTPSGRARPRRREVPQRHTRRTAPRHHRYRGSRVIIPRHRIAGRVTTHGILV